MGNFRTKAQTNKHSIKGQGNGFHYYVSHMCGWRLYMEDAHISVPALADKSHALFAVFDGHGGAEVAAFTERHFVKELEANPHYSGSGGKPKNYGLALQQTFMKMDQLLLSNEGKKEVSAIQEEMRRKDNGPKHEEDSHAGCTGNVVLITSDRVYCANAGDSRAVASVGGTANPLSVDHKPQDPIELERIQKAGGTVNLGRVDGGLNLSRAIGDLEYKKNGNLKAEEQKITAWPDVKTVDLKGIDFIIMGCDGIWQIKTNQEMVDWVSKRIQERREGQLILEELLDELVSKDQGNQFGMDNMSSILITFPRKG